MSMYSASAKDIGIPGPHDLIPTINASASPEFPGIHARAIANCHFGRPPAGSDVCFSVLAAPVPACGGVAGYGCIMLRAANHLCIESYELRWKL